MSASRAINGVPTPTLTLQLSHVMSWRIERTMFCLDVSQQSQACGCIQHVKVVLINIRINIRISGFDF